MEILVLGGTAFVGRAIVEALEEADHRVTLFTRGRTNPDLFPSAPRLVGDRQAGDYRALGAGRWDATVDVSAYVPRHVAEASDALGERSGRFLFISTGSVYDFGSGDGPLDESVPRLPPERGTEVVDADTYGPLKVACEDEAQGRFGSGCTIVRPGIVAGPYDPTDRFTWWVRRAAAGGTVRVPASPGQPVQVVDSRDLARLVRSLLEADRGGVYNAVGPAEPTTLAGLARACAAAMGTSLGVEEAHEAEAPPLVLGAGTPSVVFSRDASAARAAGLTATPLERTAGDVAAWDAERGRPPLTVGPPL